MKWFKKLFKRLFGKKEIIQLVLRDDLTLLEGIKITSSGLSIIDKKPEENEIYVSKKIIIFTKYKDMYLISVGIEGFKVTAPFPDGILFTDKIPLMNIKESEFDYMMNKFRESNYNINVEIQDENP